MIKTLLKVTVAVVFSLMLAVTPISCEIKQKLFPEIVGNRVATTGVLKTFTPYINHNSVKKSCFHECLKTINCEFVCILQDGIRCDLYNFFVTPYWVGDTTGTLYSSCYTGWHLPNNIIRPDMAITYSGMYSATYSPEHLIDGFARRTDEIYCFHSNSKPNSYWQVDLGAPVRVKAVTVTIAFNNEFKNVDVRLGNSSNHLSNPVFGSFATYASHVSITITGAVFAGQYFALSNQGSGYLVACELQVHRE